MSTVSERVIELCDAETVCRGLGIRLGRRNGDRIQMICPCPNHNDQKFGNCNLNTSKKLFHCFSCGVGGSIIDIVMMHYGWDPADRAKSYDAMRECCELCGVDSSFISDKKTFKRMLVAPSLTEREIRLLGLNKDSIEDPNNPEKTYDPLVRLRNEDEEGYCFLILERARGIIEEYRGRKIDELKYVALRNKPAGNLNLTFLNIDTKIAEARKIEDKILHFLIRKRNQKCQKE